MKQALRLLVAVGFGASLGWMFHASPEPAAAGGNPLPPCQDINGDGQSDVSDAIFFLQWQFLGGPEPACPASNGGPARLPATGQAGCADSSGGFIRNCASVPCRGQDGSYATGCPAQNRFTDNGDATVTDTCTGLMWQKDIADVNGDGQTSDDGADGLVWCDALAYCESLSFAGRDDWRLPNVRELQSLIDYGRYNPSFDPVFGEFYFAVWSSTSYAANANSAWHVFFGWGIIFNVDKTLPRYVRAVRG